MGAPGRVGRVWLTLVFNHPLETLTAISFLLWLVYLTAPWNPWDAGSGTARTMDGTGIPRPGWVGVVLLVTILKWDGVITGRYWSRMLGAVGGFSFWIFICVVIFRVAPASVIVIQFIMSALASAMIFWNLMRERSLEQDFTSYQHEEIEQRKEDDAARTPAA